MMTKSLYAVLNVAPNADPAVIEAAYKALMKKYHPDIAAGTSNDEDRASEINEAYQVLRDAERRLEYDRREQARLEAVRRAVPMPRPVIYTPPPPAPRKHRKWPVLLLIAALAALVFAVSEERGQGWGAAETARTMLASTQHALGASGVLSSEAVTEAEVRRAAATFQRIRNEMGLMGLSAYSQDCFAAQQRTPSTARFDHCVAFDHLAAGYEGELPGGYLPQIPRFQPRELSLRHAEAGTLLSSDEGWVSRRIAKIKGLATKAVQPAQQPAVGARLVVPAYASHTQRVVRRPRAARQAYRQQPVKRRKAADRDFLEREGYIY